MKKELTVFICGLLLCETQPVGVYLEKGAGNTFLQYLLFITDFYKYII